MKTVDDILREMREFADKQEKNGYYDLREMSTDSLRACANLIEAARKRKVVVAEMETTTPTCEKSSQVGDRMLDLLNRVHDFLGKLCRDGRCDDHCSECIGASDLADDVWDLIQSCKEHSQVGNAAAMREALEKLLHGEYKDRCEVTQIAHVALSKPPRNCDVIDVMNADDEFEKAMRYPPSQTADERDELMRENWYLFKLWLFAEAKGAEK